MSESEERKPRKQRRKRNKPKKKKTNKIWYILSALVIILIAKDIQEPEIFEAYVEKVKTRIPILEQESRVDVIRDRGSYRQVTIEELEERYKELAGEYVRVSGQIDRVVDGVIKYSNRVGGISAGVRGIKKDSIYPGTYVEVCGIVPSTAILGEIELQSSWVAAKGEEARNTYEQKQEEVNLQEEQDMAERRQRLKESISPYRYTAYVENPTEYIGNVIRVEGEVTEIKEYEGMRYYYVSAQEGGYFKGLASEETVIVDLMEVPLDREVYVGGRIVAVGIFTGINGFDRVYLKRQENLPMMRLEFVE